MIKTLNPKFGVITLDSKGGDIISAINISRYLRKITGGYTVFIPRDSKCLSACVLILAGASRRNVVGDVGIHRPYPLATSPEKSLESIRQNQAQLKATVITFLTEVGIPQNLYDEMMTVPSHKIKILTTSELQHFGLSEDDPAIEEETNAVGAKEFGVSISEYLVRRAKAERLFSDTECYIATLWGISVREFRRRKEIIKERCSNDSDSNTCSFKIFREGK